MDFEIYLLMGVAKIAVPLLQSCVAKNKVYIFLTTYYTYFQEKFIICKNIFKLATFYIVFNFFPKIAIALDTPVKRMK